MNAPPPTYVETDDRFPTGIWVGYFLQRTVTTARQTMELDLLFRDGRLSGNGRDGIGSFTITGSYETDDGKVRWTKCYRWYDVVYEGYAEAKGIWGMWEIAPFDRDGFHIWPRGTNADGEAMQRAESRPISFEDDALTREPLVAAPD